MIEHPPFATLAARSIDGWLDKHERVEFEAHLTGCASCRALVMELRTDHERMAGIRPMTTSPALRRQVLAATHRRARPAAWLLVAAALLAVAATIGALTAGAYLARLFERPAIELSADWQAIPAADLAAGASTSRIRAVVAASDRFVAVGSAGGQAAAWTSTDGATWPRSPNLPDGVGAELVAVEVGGPGFVAAGRSGSGGAIWTSPDGVTWTAAGPADVFPEAVVNVLRRSDDGWIAAGAAVGSAGLTGATWVSPDGLTWQGSIPSVGVSSGNAFVSSLGLIFRRPDGVWIARPLNDPVVAYRSLDGLRWDRMVDDVPDLGRTRDVRHVGGTLVAVGGPQPLWSVDGLTWSASAISPPVDGSLESMEVLPDGVVAMGKGPKGAFVYRSTDGRAFLGDADTIGGVESTVYDVATSAGVEVAVGIDRGAGAVWSRTR